MIGRDLAKLIHRELNIGPQRGATSVGDNRIAINFARSLPIIRDSKWTTAPSRGGIQIPMKLTEHMTEWQRVQDAERMKGTLILKYLCISRSMGRRLANTLRCVWMTPLGSPVVPEVKTICTVSSSRRLATGLSKGSRGSIPSKSSNAICGTGRSSARICSPTAGHKLRAHLSYGPFLQIPARRRYPTEPELRRARRIRKRMQSIRSRFAPQINHTVAFCGCRAPQVPGVASCSRASSA